MSRFLSVFIMLVLSASLFAVDVTIPENDATSNGGAIVSDVQYIGTLIWDLEAQNLGLTSGAYNVGAQIYAGHFLIITEGQTSLEFHVIDLLDSTVHHMPQTGASGWGYRDMCIDAGDTIYGSVGTPIQGFILDTIAWTMTNVNNYTGITSPNRALAYVPGDTFWTANFSSALGWFEKGGTSGNGSPANACYGAAYVPATGLVWYHGQVGNAGGWDCTWFMYDIGANAWGDTAYCPVPAYAAGYTNKMAGGGCFVQDFLGMGPALIGLCQGDMDFVYAFTFPELSPSLGNVWDFEDGWQGWTHTSDSTFPAAWDVQASDYKPAYTCPDAGDSSMWIDSDAAGSFTIIDTASSPAFASFPETYLKWAYSYNEVSSTDSFGVLIGQWSGGVLTWTKVAEYLVDENGTYDSVDVSGYSADSFHVAFYYEGSYDYYAAFDNVGPVDTIVLAVEETPVEMPQVFNYRMLSTNPIANNAVIEFALPVNGTVNFTVYDVTGRTVLMQNHGVLNAGVHSLTWNRNDNSGNQVAAGSYFFRLEAAGNVATGKFVVTE